VSGVRGLIGGVAGLALLEVTVSNQTAAGRVGGIFTTAASWLARWLDPNVPLIPDLRAGAVNPFSGSTTAPTATGSLPNYTAPPAATGSLPNYTTPRRLPATPQTPAQSGGATTTLQA
jgi:hypothetical protein